MSLIYLDWEDVNINWEDMDMNWEDVYLISEVRNVIKGNSDGYEEYVRNNPWKKISESIGEEKTQKFIKIFCKINNFSYEKIVEKKSIKIKASHFDRVFERAPQIKIKI